MADEWYYWHDADVLGPFTAARLTDLALAGRILPTDTVWREGVEEGVPASRVKHLFPAPATAAEGPESAPASADASPAEAGRTSSGLWDSAGSTSKTTRRAVAGKGAVLVGQDGTTVKYRKKCTSCGHEDSSYKSAPISRGTTRVSFYCPKCRRNCAVEIHGHVS
jgi:predicted RNA-binding Zn-ribbon protein involved in translation (DUF1610 family)